MSDWTVLLEELASVKEQLKKIKDKEAILNQKVKKELDSQGIEKGIYNGIKVNYMTVAKTTLDEEKLVDILIQLSQCNPEIKRCLFYKLVVNEDILEDLCYTGIVDPNDLVPAYSETYTKRLTVSKVKKND